MGRIIPSSCLFCLGFASAVFVAAGQDCSNEAEGCPSSAVPTSNGWLHSFQAGRTGIPGTEIMQLEIHKGSLFASVGYWMLPTHQPGRILRLDCHTCEWQMEHPAPNNLYMDWSIRLESLKSFSWITESGTDELLHATGYIDVLGEAHCFFCTRNDASALWSCEPYFKKTPYAEKTFTARSMHLYLDPITKAQRVIIPTGKHGVIQGRYTADSPVRVTFDQQVEPGSESLPQRPLALAEMDGHVYMAVGQLIMKRTKGVAVASWTTVFDMLQHDTSVSETDESVGGLRGLTTVDNPTSPTKQSLLVSWNPNGRSKGCIYRLDPNEAGGFSPSLEKCVKQIMQDEYVSWGKFPYAISAYNNMLPVPAKNLGRFSGTCFSFPLNPKR